MMECEKEMFSNEKERCLLDYEYLYKPSFLKKVRRKREKNNWKHSSLSKKLICIPLIRFIMRSQREISMIGYEVAGHE